MGTRYGIHLGGALFFTINSKDFQETKQKIWKPSVGVPGSIDNVEIPNVRVNSLI